MSMIENDIRILGLSAEQSSATKEYPIQGMLHGNRLVSTSRHSNILHIVNEETYQVLTFCVCHQLSRNNVCNQINKK
jgi:hypothetical protein